MSSRSSPPRMRRIIGIALLTALATPAALGQDEPDDGWRYAFGQGLRHGASGLTLGGYVTAEAQKLRGEPAQQRFSHASAFVWWEPIDRLKLLLELDQLNLVARERVERPGRPSQDTPTRRTSLERAHLNWSFSDALTLSGGKFLTPVGRWNLLHADPLTWTSSRPLLTQAVLPTNVTGVMASGRLAAGETRVEFALYASNGNEWRADPQQDLFGRVRGGRLVWQPAAAWQLGLSVARYEQRTEPGRQRALEGLDARWSAAGYELTAEWLRTRFGSAPPTLPALPGRQDPGSGSSSPGAANDGQPQAFIATAPSRGFYLQGVVPLTAGWFAVARAERLTTSATLPAVRQSTLGMVWRPHPAAVFKLEHQWTDGRPELAAAGWTASVSVLF